jgi:hypothetical protein
MNLKRTFNLFIAVALVLTLGCGGGGGGADNAPPKPSPTVNLDQSSLKLGGFEGHGVGPLTIHCTFSGFSGLVYIGATSSIPNAFQAAINIENNSSATCTISQVIGYNPPAGIQDGTFTFIVSSDPDGKNILWSKTLPLQLAIFKVDAPDVAFASYEGCTTPSTSKLTLTPADSSGLVKIHTSTTWLSAIRSGNDAINLAASTAGLGGGSYTGSLDLEILGSTISLPISLNLQSDTQVSGAETFVVSASTTQNDLAGTVQIAFKDNANHTWHASSDTPWLLLKKTDGVGASNLGYTISPTALESLQNFDGAPKPAVITVQADGLTPVSVQILVKKRLPEVFGSFPSSIASLTASQINVFGRGFIDPVKGNTANFKVGSISISSVTVHSDTSATIQIEALPAGTYSISGQTSFDTALKASRLAVIDTASIPYSVAPTTGEIRAAFYDPSRQSVFTVSVPDSSIQRFQWSTSDAKWVSKSLQVPSIREIGMSPDNSVLYVTSETSTLLAVDPDLMQVIGSYSPGTERGDPMWVNNLSTDLLHATRDNRLWIFSAPSLCYFDINTGQFKTPYFQGSEIFIDPLFATPDRSILFTRQPWSTSWGLTYEVATQSFTGRRFYWDGYSDRGSNEATDIVASSDGSTVLLGNYIYYYGSFISGADPTQTVRAYKYCGALSSGGVATYPVANAISLDGTCGYRAVSSTPTSLSIDHIQVTKIDQSAYTAASADSIPVHDQASLDTPPVFFMSPLGDYLFLAGDKNLVVIPIPSNLRSTASPAFRLNRSIGLQKAH